MPEKSLLRRASERPPAGLAPPTEDIRRARPYALSTVSLRAFGRRLVSICSLLALDFVGLALALYAGLVLRELYHGSTTIFWAVLYDAEVAWLPFLMLVTALVFWQAGLYASRERRGGSGRIVSSLILVAAITLAFSRGIGHHSPYGLVPTVLVLAAVLIGLLRASYDVLTGELLRVAGVRRKTVLVGEGARLAHLHRTLGSARGGIDYEFLGVVAPRADDVGLPVLGALEELPRVLASREVDELIVADSDLDEQQLLELVGHAHRQGVKVRIAPKTTELLIQTAEYVPGQGVPLFELRPPALAGADWAVKRAFDLVMSSFVLVLGLPLWLLIAAAIKVSSRGPVLYRDHRIGVGEREFAMLKFRTMFANAADRQEQLEGANEAGGAIFKIRRDPRVTPVGRALRRFSLDECPQVLNVLRGEMSLVGPRPLPLRDYARLEEWHRKRYLVLPGMTGLWQISGRSDLSFDDLVRLDFYYLDNWSIWLDISILAKTLPAVVAGGGAY